MNSTRIKLHNLTSSPISRRTLKWWRASLNLRSLPKPPNVSNVNDFRSFSPQQREIQRWLRHEAQYIHDTLFKNESFNQAMAEIYADILDIHKKAYMQSSSEVMEAVEQGGDIIGDFVYFSDPESHDLLRVPLRERLTAPGQIVLTLSELRQANGTPKSPVQVSSVRISSDGDDIAVIADFTKDCSNPCLMVKNLKTGAVQKISEKVLQVEWMNPRDDLKSLFFVTSEPNTPERFALRGSQLWKLNRCGKKQLLFEELDSRRFLTIASTKDLRYLYVNSLTKSSSEISIIHPSGDLQVVFPRKEGVMYFIDHNHGKFFIIWNTDDTQSFKVNIVRNNGNIPLQFETSQEVIQVDQDTSVEEVEILNDFVVLFCRGSESKGHYFLKIYKIDDQFSRADLVSTVSSNSIPHITPGLNELPNASILKLRVSSPVIPEKDVDLELSKVKSSSSSANCIIPKVQSAVEFCEWETVQIPGNSVPLTILKPLKLDNYYRPALIIAYGAYGQATDLRFSESYLSLVKRGWHVCLAHVRGGNELGRKWYNEGKLCKKLNSFFDLEDCVNYVKIAGFVDPNLIAGYGYSAGGMLFAELVSRKPEVFAGVVLRMPFLCVLDSMLDKSSNLTEHEFDEWGDPSSDPRILEVMKLYDPFLSLTEESVRNFPHSLITTSIKDARVPFENVARYVARIRTLQERMSDLTSKVLLEVDEEFGHAGSYGLQGSFKRDARDFAFLEWVTRQKL